MLVDPAPWAVLGFGDETAWLDFLGQHGLEHFQFDAFVREHLGAPAYPVFPLGDGGGDDWHDAHQSMHEAEAAAVLLDPPPDFRSYDLKQPDQFASWTWLHAQEHQRLNAAAGV